MEDPTTPADPGRAAPVAWAIVCLAEQNAMMLGLGFPSDRSVELREQGRILVASLRDSRKGADTSLG